MSVDNLKPGQSAIVTEITAVGALQQRLLDVGILPGATVGVERSGPGGQPLWIRCQGVSMALLRSEADSIRVRDIS
jgi:Fe2+ transport system protein FeoA